MTLFPALHRGSRRAPFLRLLAVAVLRGIGGLALLGLLRPVDRLSEPAVLAALLLVMLALALLRALETIESERLGQVYVRALRRRLVLRLREMPVAARRRFGRGALWLRLSSDLNGLRRWISQGWARALGAGVTLLTLVSGLFLAGESRAAAAVLAALLILLALLRLREPALGAAEASLRRARGRLASRVDQWLDALDQPAGQPRPGLDRRADAVRDQAIARAVVRAGPRALAEALPLLLALALLLLAAAPGGGAAAWALAALLAGPFRDAVLAWELRQGYAVSRAALARLSALPEAEASAPLAPSPGDRFNDTTPVASPASSRGLLFPPEKT
ncbi:MAG TPA: hypothetical protein VFV27_10740 [Nevskiaceae bacterium]|nr:hypothetical protein [Nevskiaceae bacterium]